MNKKQLRAQALMPNGVPRYVRCYDNGGETADQYTLVFTGHYPNRAPGEYAYISASSYPYHPAIGIWLHGGANAPIDRPVYSHLGKPIRFEDLPEDVQTAFINDYRDLWEIGSADDFTTANGEVVKLWTRNVITMGLDAQCGPCIVQGRIGRKDDMFFFRSEGVDTVFNGSFLNAEFYADTPENRKMLRDSFTIKNK